MENRKFSFSESVVIKHTDGSRSSGMVVNEVSENTYLVYYCSPAGLGWIHGLFSGDLLVPFDGALFMAVDQEFTLPETADAQIAEAAG